MNKTMQAGTHAADTGWTLRFETEPLPGVR